MIQQTGLGAGTVPPTASLISTGLLAGSTISAATGGTAAALAAFGIGAQAVPLVGTIIGGIALAVVALGIGNGCGQTCVASTTVVNNVEPVLQQNLQAAQQQAQINGGCLTSAELTVCQGVFSQVWSYVVANCTQVGGPGGSNCINDRQRGGKWDWYAMYLDPINVIPVCSNPVSTATTDISSLVSSVSSGSISPVYLAAGAFLLAYFLS